MPLTEPLGNNVLVEVIRDYAGVSRADENESKNKGIVIDAHLEAYHLTASAALELDISYREVKSEELHSMIGGTVRWEEFAEGGQTFTEDGKEYALIPWWRLISYEPKKGDNND